MGLAPQVFNGEILHGLVGKMAVGHTRYSTTGSSHVRNAPPLAVDCARDYARENRFGPEMELICGTLQDLAGRVRPDLVLANLDRHTLLLLADELAAYGAEGARLLFSGVLVDQEAEVVGRYSALGLYPAGRREQDGWVALELLRAESCEGVGG